MKSSSFYFLILFVGRNYPDSPYLKEATFKKLKCNTTFNLIYDLNPKWKERSEKEKALIFNNYIILEQDGIILGGFALSDYKIDGEKGKLLECLFSSKKGNGLGYILGEEIKKQNLVFVYSKEENFFKNIGFKKVEGQKSESGASFFVYKKTEYSIGIIGSGGAVGVQLKQLLNNHPIFNNCVSKPTVGLSKLQLTEWNEKIKSILYNNEIVVLAVHDDIAKEIINIKEKVGFTTKIIDCSTAHRINTAWIYGLPELKNYKEKIKVSELIANPGCHATAVILSVKPLVMNNLVENESAIITSITGYSGGGKEMITTYEQDNKKASLQYSTGTKHKHEAEIKDQTGLENIIFQPEVVNYFNGLKTNVFLQLTEKGKDTSEEDIIKLFEIYYEGKQFIKVKNIPSNGKILMNENNKTQYSSIYIKKYSNKIQVVTVIDNMMKGAAGAVLQNLNIMLGLDENMGLENN